MPRSCISSDRPTDNRRLMRLRPCRRSRRSPSAESTQAQRKNSSTFSGTMRAISRATSSDSAGGNSPRDVEEIERKLEPVGTQVGRSLQPIPAPLEGVDLGQDFEGVECARRLAVGAAKVGLQRVSESPVRIPVCAQRIEDRRGGRAVKERGKPVAIQEARVGVHETLGGSQVDRHDGAPCEGRPPFTPPTPPANPGLRPCTGSSGRPCPSGERGCR